MSQFWHAHCAEDAYKPGLLGNWQVPNWHPKWPCIRHCVTTTFLADKSGRLLPDKPRSKRSPWGNFKGTWELPLKIDRKLAHKLSAPPEYKLAAWKAHKNHYEGPCGFAAASPKINKTKTGNQAARRKSPVRIAKRTNSPNARSKSPKIKDKKTEATVIKKKRNTSAPRKTADNTDRSRKRNQLEKHFEDKSKARKDGGEIVTEGIDYDQEKAVTEIPEYEEDRTVTEEPEYKKEETVTEESHVAKTVRKHRRKHKKPECYCVNELDSHTPPEIVQKATSNICTIHQRLRL